MVLPWGKHGSLKVLLYQIGGPIVLFLPLLFLSSPLSPFFPFHLPFPSFHSILHLLPSPFTPPPPFSPPPNRLMRTGWKERSMVQLVSSPKTMSTLLFLSHSQLDSHRQSSPATKFVFFPIVKHVLSYLHKKFLVCIMSVMIV